MHFLFRPRDNHGKSPRRQRRSEMQERFIVMQREKRPPLTSVPTIDDDDDGQFEQRWVKEVARRAKRRGGGLESWNAATLHHRTTRSFTYSRPSCFLSTELSSLSPTGFFCVYCFAVSIVCSDRCDVLLLLHQSSDANPMDDENPKTATRRGWLPDLCPGTARIGKLKHLKLLPFSTLRTIST